MTPLEAAAKRLLLAMLYQPCIIREPGLLETISRLLPRAHEPLTFSAFPPQLQVSHGSTRVSKHHSDRWGKYRTAVCTKAPMTRDKHYAEFRLIKKVGWIRVGVVKAKLLCRPSGAIGCDDEDDCSRVNNIGFDASRGGSATASEFGWGFNVALGSCWHNSGFTDWDGQHAAETGDVVGMLLDVDVGCLDVFINGKRLGQMVACSANLSRAAKCGLYWMAELHDAADQVEIEGKQPPQLD